MLESGRPQRVAEQKLAILKAAGLEAEIVADGKLCAIRLTGPLATRLEDELRRLEELHGWVLESARGQGIELVPYKPLDRAEIVAALASAWQEDVQRPDGAGRLWHELVWAQGFPNGNHRTATAYLEAVLNPAGSRKRDLAARPEWLERLFVASKALIPEKEFAPEPRLAKAKHLEISRAAFRDWSSREDAR